MHFSISFMDFPFSKWWGGADINKRQLQPCLTRAWWQCSSLSKGLSKETVVSEGRVREEGDIPHLGCREVKKAGSWRNVKTQPGKKICSMWVQGRLEHKYWKENSNRKLNAETCTQRIRSVDKWPQGSGSEIDAVIKPRPGQYHWGTCFSSSMSGPGQYNRLRTSICLIQVTWISMENLSIIPWRQTAF